MLVAANQSYSCDFFFFSKDESHRKQKSHDNISANHSEEKHADRRNI